MAKLQNKLFVKLKVVEEKGLNILEDLKICQQHLAMTVTQCKGLLQDSVKDPDQFLFGLGRMLDDVGNVLFLTIARVGARAPGPQPETEPGDVEHQEEDDIVTMEMKNKLREVLRLAQTLQSFCRLTVEDTQKRLDYASNIRDEFPHDLKVLGEISPLLSLSGTLLTEVSLTVLKVLNNLVNLNHSHPELRTNVESGKTGADENGEEKVFSEEEEDLSTHVELNQSDPPIK